ncbi:HAD-IIA family hydrolase [Luteolibacter sp. Y139]|uniref:HAD-IIA family hydrolase n=2 Tax=Luteolibacter soli TaxID=3135280 RepID=A0ABU9ARS4_9BACT
MGYPHEDASVASPEEGTWWHGSRWFNGMATVGFLLDMDGVIYRGSRLIPGASDFINRLRNHGIPFRFLTNNSQRARRDVALKLHRLGIEASENEVFTCAMATARFLASQKPNGTAYVIGEHGLAAALHRNGLTVVDDDPDFVVVGEGRTMTFEMIERGVRLVEKGARLIATNPDPNCPTDQGTRPGCGAIVAMIERATGVEAFSVGKPSPVMMRAARKEMGLRTDEVIMVGDTMETDILGAVQMGYRSVLVLSGGTCRKDLKKFAYEPDLIVDHIGMIPDSYIFGKLEPALAP